jgi:hypothetical protein
METITNDIIAELKQTSTYDGFVDIVVASQITDSESLYQDGIHRIISSGQTPTQGQSRRMGTDATHTVMMAVMDTLKVEVASVRSEMNTKLKAENAERVKAETALANADNTRCRYCSGRTQWTCSTSFYRKVQTTSY